MKDLDPVRLAAFLCETGFNLRLVANQNDVLFLEGMYREGAAPYFDILSTMLYGLGQPPDRDAEVDWIAAVGEEDGVEVHGAGG